MERYDVAIVGAGPIGVELSAALKQAGVRVLHLEAKQVGHTISWFPRQATFFSSPERIAICGVPLQTPDQTKATREQYLAYLRGVVQQFGLKINCYEKVMGIDKTEQGFLLRTDKGGEVKQYEAGKVVLAVGDMARPRMLRVEGEDLPHVSHYFDEPHDYFGQRLLVVGGRNSAVEAAIRCYRAGAKVAISYRRENFDKRWVKYWLYPEIRSLIKSGDIVFYPESEVKRIEREWVDLCDVKDSSERMKVEADFVLLMTGYEADHSLLEMCGVALQGENRSPKVNLKTMESSVEGVYVAGTAAAGTQNNFRLFIENCHVHVARIAADITGCDVGEVMEKIYILEES